MAHDAISVAGNLIETIESEAIQNIYSKWGYNNDVLEELRNIITSVKDVLLDVDSKVVDLSHENWDYIAELKDAVYGADQLFDEFRTLAELNLIDGDQGQGGQCCAKVRRFFCFDKEKLSQLPSMFRSVENVKKRFKDIGEKYPPAKTYFFSNPIVRTRRREETYPYVYVKNIIGREDDKNAIIDMLFSPNGDDDDEDVRFLTIVGVGGLGKTALAQLVFNDEKIVKEFSTYMVWVCVSDQDGVQFEVKAILSKILDAVTEERCGPCYSPSTELEPDQFQELFRGKKYLLILDDVWNEEPHKWLELKKYLMIGATGSKVLITSRSEETGRIIGNKHVYKLQVLSNEYSQRLFEMAAFKGGDKPPELIKIGERIVRQYYGNPLAIMVVGSLLYGRDIREWELIEKSGLASNEHILSTMMLSYNNLAPTLKSCFSYCAVYPKDFRIYKEYLIGQWMAHGYIVPLDAGQSVEEAAEEHFSILMRRGFFENIEKDEYGNVVFVKIHNLMHNVAQEVSKDEICVVTRSIQLGPSVRHVNITGDVSVGISSCSGTICSYIRSSGEEHLLDRGIENMRALRVLDLSYLGIKSLPQTIGFRLLLLRYLNLSNNYSLEVLPDSITRLNNLQTLILRNCKNLREIPKDFSNLTNLGHLDFYGCDKLNEMPLGILKLSNLRVLPYYVSSNEISDEELTVLQQVFTRLKGKICINNMRTGDSKSRKPMVKLTINYGYEGEWVIHEGVFEKLEQTPYLYVNELCLSRYNCKTIPCSNPYYLLCMEIMISSNLEQIPALSKLPYLKSLKLISLNSMKYMENGMSSSSNGVKAVAEFFPSLESLEIGNMEKLKGWWKGEFIGVTLSFPRLSHLKISGCPKLKSFAPCSNPYNLPEHQLPGIRTLQIISCPNLASNFVCSSTLEKLVLNVSSERLVITSELGELREMVVDKIDYLKLLPPTYNCLTTLILTGDIEVESALEHVQSCVSSLRTLYFIFCENLRKLPRLDHFIALEQLTLRGSFKLFVCEEDDDEAWQSLPQSLRLLVFSYLPKMKCLPKGIRRLSSLQSLKIWDCQGIKSLPEEIKDLTSLEKLSIRLCPHLKERCKEHDGEDFSKIQHIPDREIS